MYGKVTVNDLPMEVLAYVFQHIQQDRLGSFTFPYPTPDAPREVKNTCKNSPFRELVTIQHVCRYWRQVLQTFPLLWTTIFLPAPHYVTHSGEVVTTCGHNSDQDESHGPRKAGWCSWPRADVSIQLPTLGHIGHCLSLSGSHPLSVYSVDHVHGLNLVERQAHRLRHLQIGYTLKSVPAVFNIIWNALDGFRAPVPLLESLDIGLCIPEDADAWSDHDGIDMPIRGLSLPVLFSQRMPRLKRLRLAGVAPWTRNHFRRLTHLCLTGWRLMETSPTNIHELLSLLRQSPGLEEVYLSHLDPWIYESLDEPPVVNDKGDAIHLRKLRRLSVSDCYAAQILVLFAYLHVPVGSAVVLSKIQGTGVNIDSVGICTRYPTHFGNMSELHRVELETTYYESKGLAFGPSGALQITTMRAGDWQSLSRPLHFTKLPLSSLEKLCLHNMAVQEVFRTLTPESDESDDNDNKAVPCELLQTLWMSDPEEEDLDYYDALLRCAKTRHARKFPLKSVRMDGLDG
ncbi:hypothetical protein BXZ70DRAFT_203456 [Cristinia sonorae]|uniref:F-box domain-containing protein n=1 Tax=Cristinia sonorae TaxID=1940300 RepID=A0A8K0UMH7_9AGAR|nr:hypothetical protein BXZ70DRAFT_203456 [Cristinia sonorae]